MKKLQMYHTAVSSLVIAAIVIGLLFVAVNDVATWYRSHEAAIGSTLFTLRAAHFAWGMDRLYDSLPEQPIEMGEAVDVTSYLSNWWGMSMNDERFGPLITTTLAFFQYEGIVNQTRIPRMIVWVPFAQGFEHFHIAGRASCSQAMFLINYEYVNPLSSRYQEDSFAQVFIHELGHTQGICCLHGSTCSPGQMETDNQVATLEILAALCNRGHSWACKPLIHELRDEALHYVKGSCYDNGTMRYYDWFIRTFIYTTAEERSRLDKSNRYWDSTEENRHTLRYIVTAYGMRPFYVWSTVLERDDLMTNYSPYYPNRTGKMKLDDLHYFLTHLGQMKKIASQPQ